MRRETQRKKKVVLEDLVMTETSLKKMKTSVI
jgi:hypothetical protein